MTLTFHLNALERVFPACAVDRCLYAASKGSDRCKKHTEEA